MVFTAHTRPQTTAPFPRSSRRSAMTQVSPSCSESLVKSKRHKEASLSISAWLRMYSYWQCDVFYELMKHTLEAPFLNGTASLCIHHLQALAYSQVEL